MRICCTICGDLFQQNAIISTITCGHTFHNDCLLKWFENSKSCPQCRQKVTTKNVHRIYLDICDVEPSQIDTDELQHKIDSLKVVEKDQLISRMSEENDVLQEQSKGLREECTKLEKKITEMNVKLSAYSEQNKHMNKMIQQVSKTEDDLRKVNAQLKLYQHIDNILQDNDADIEDTISANLNISNPQENIRSLATVMSFLKSHITKLKEEKRKNIEDINNLSTKLIESKKIIFTLQSKIKDYETGSELLKGDIESLERENLSLLRKISVLQESIQSPSADVKNSVIQRFISESPAPSSLKKQSPESQSIELALTPEVIKTNKMPLSIDTSNKEKQSPYLQVKSSSINPAIYRRPLAASTSSNTNKSTDNTKSSIFKYNKVASNFNSGLKNPPNVAHFVDDDFGYDGLGGHHKVDYFPQPNAKKLIPGKRKKPMHILTNKGLKRVASNTDIKDFFKNPFDEHVL